MEYIGHTIPGNCVIEPDGAIELVDSLKSVAEGAPDLGMNVFDHSFTEVLGHPKMRARQAGRVALSDTCKQCSLVDICGGGYQPHRYSEQNGYQNPSVFCPDLTKLIEHIGNDVVRRVSAAREQRLSANV